MTPPQEKARVFGCGGDRLAGILHAPAARVRDIGVLVVVGGPQYRVGSHRQFVLMAREFAAAGYPVLRFDHRGIGDSDGAPRSFETLDDDVRAALDTLHAEFPGLKGSVIFGLCDAASAALMYCRRDERLVGLILANPWVHSEAGAAKAYVKHYYGQRLLQPAFWRKVFSGEFDAAGSLRDLLAKLRASGRRPKVPRGSFRERMLDGLAGFDGPVLLQVSGRDLTAAEFMDLCQSDARWHAALDRRNVVVRRYESADHTFAAAGALHAAVADCTAWLDALPGR
jgi:exosortase A-associated hydrolase 1